MTEKETLQRIIAVATSRLKELKFENVTYAMITKNINTWIKTVEENLSDGTESFWDYDSFIERKELLDVALKDLQNSICILPDWTNVALEEFAIPTILKDLV